MSISTWQAVRIQQAAQHTPTHDERRRDQELAARITAQSDDAIAYDHASHGCPFADEGTCSVCDHTDEEIFI